MNTIGRMIIVFFIVSSCGEATSEQKASSATTTNPTSASVEASPEKELTVEERILEIKDWYGELLKKGVKKSCVTKIDTTYEGFAPGEEEYPFENSASNCAFENGFSQKTGNFHGYEWAETINFYFKDDLLFFAHSDGGAEACIYEYRAYYNRKGEVIRVLSKENDCDGEAPSIQEEVTGTEKADQIIMELAYQLRQLDEILDKK